MGRLCCSPFWEARQPGPPSALKTDSMRKPGAAEVTSTVAICARSIQRGPGPVLASLRSEATILLRTFLFSLIQPFQEHPHFLLLATGERAHHRIDETQMIGKRGSHQLPTGGRQTDQVCATSFSRGNAFDEPAPAQSIHQ